MSNRYIVFPGNLRHGVIPDKVEGKAPASERRLTLLVNYWDNRPQPPICYDYDGNIYGSLQEDSVFQASRRSVHPGAV